MQHKTSRLVLLSSILILSNLVMADDILVVNVKANKKNTPNEAKPLAEERRPVLPADGGDFLKQLSGVSGSRFGGRGIEPIIRGQSQTQLNVLLDGAYIHGGCPNRMDPPASYAALETYETIKVEKGVQTLQHGSGGSGGTVLFERDTRSQIDPEGGLSGKVSLTGSNNGVKHDLSVDMAKGGQKGYVRVFAQDRDADNYKDGNGTEVRSSYKHRQGGIVLGATPTTDRVIEYSYENNDFSDALYPGAGMDSPTEKADIHRLKYQDKFDGAVKSVDAEAYASNVKHVMDNYSLRTQTGMKTSVPTTSDTTGANVALKSAIGNTEVTYGVNIQNRKRTATMKNITGNKDVSLMWPDAKTDQSGVFAEAESKLGDNSKLKYGLRFDQVKTGAARAGEAVDGITANSRYTAVYGYGATDKTENNLGGLLRYEKSLSADTTVFTGISRTVRTADETERYINNINPTTKAPGWIGNPNIKPEKHNQLDIGISQQKGNIRWTGTVFADKVNDFILRDYARGQDGIQLNNGTTQVYRNVGARLVGAELGAEARLSDKVKLSGDIAYVKRTNTTENRAVAQTPPLNGKVQVDYNGSKWGAGARVRFAAKQGNVDALSPLEVVVAGQPVKAGGYGVLDLYGRYSISKSTKLRFGVDNVLDKAYAEAVNRRNLDPLTGAADIRVNEPGRAAWLKLETEF